MSNQSSRDKHQYQQFQKWDSGISWKLGETYLVFVQTKEKYLDVPYHRCHTGLNHLAFHAKSKKHVDEVVEELKKRNINILYKDKHPHDENGHSYAVYFEDTDRIKVELVAPLEV